MKYLTDRRDIAMMMNFGRYPVLRINLETPKAGWDDNFEGDKVMVALKDDTNRGDYIRCQLNKFGDEPKRYTLMPDPVFLDNGFGYSDVIEMLEWAQAPIIHPGEKVIVIEDYPAQRTCKVHMMQVSKTARKFVYPTCYLEEVEVEDNK